MKEKAGGSPPAQVHTFITACSENRHFPEAMDFAFRVLLRPL